MSGITFGNVKLYRFREHYRQWLKDTLLEASKLSDQVSDQHRIMEFRGLLNAPAVIDEGMLPCSFFQKHDDVCRTDNKMMCFVVFIRYLVQTWWACSTDDPQKIEGQLIRLDSLVENWGTLIVYGDERVGYKLGVV